MSNPITIDQFRSMIDASKVQCALCSYTGHSIVEHLQERHKVSPGQYKKENPSAKLASPMVTELIRRMNRRQPVNDSFNVHAEIFSIKGSTYEEKLTNSVSAMAPVPDELKEFIPKRDPFFEFEEDVESIIYCFARGKNMMFRGPTGCGKTEAIMQAFAVMGRPIRRVNMHGDVTAATFVGEKDANILGTYFKEGILPWCMEKGVPLIVDEVDFTPPNIASQLHPVMDTGRMLYIPEAGKTYQAVKGFTLYMTGNTGGKGDATGVYTGTEILNTAFLNRISICESKAFLSEKKEIAMLSRRFPSAEVSYIAKLVKACNEVRVAFAQGTLSICFSTRSIIEVLDASSVFGYEKSIIKVMMNWLDSDDRNLVYTFFDRCGIKLPKV